METINKRILIISALIIFGLIIFVIIYSIIPRATLQFETAPHQINLLIDDVKYSIKNNDSINLNPGKHNLSATRDGFEKYNEQIDIKNKETKKIVIALTPITAAAKKLLDNTESQNVIFHFGEKIYTQQTDQMTKNYPIAKILPIYAKYYTVYMCGSQLKPDDNTKLAVCVDYTQQTTDLKPYVIKDINSRGYKLDSYEIIWKQTTN